MGITNTPGTISAFVLPALVGALVGEQVKMFYLICFFISKMISQNYVYNKQFILWFQHTYQKWEYVFWINIVAQMLAFLIFLIFGSAKIQNWNYPDGQPPAIAQEL